MKRVLTLWLLLCRGEKEERDERIQHQMQSSRVSVLTFVCLVLLGVFVFYLKGDAMNKSQLAAFVTGAVFLLAGGLGLSYCGKGMITASGKFGGKDVILAGMAAAGLHWGMSVPIRQHFGAGLFFVDGMAVGMAAFYLLCNGAYCAWETMQRLKDEAEGEEEMCGAEHLYRRKQAVFAVLFAFLILAPGILQYQVFSDKTMEEAESLQEERERKASTPEYQAFAALHESWERDREKTSVRVYKTRLAPMFFEEQNPVYEEGGCLYLQTEELRMKIGFAVENGEVRLIQCNYFIKEMEEKDWERTEFFWLEDHWERLEELHAGMQKEQPGYDVWLNDYDMSCTDLGGMVNPLWMKENVTLSQEGELTRYDFSYSEEYLKEQDEAFQRLAGINSRTREKTLEFLADQQGDILEYAVSETSELLETKTLETEGCRCRYMTADEGETGALMEQMISEGPFVPQEALRIWEAMRDEK